MTHSAGNQPPLDESENDKDPIVDSEIAPPTRSDLPNPILAPDRNPGVDHPVATAIGAAGGGAAGAVVGKEIGGQMGALVGAAGGVMVGAVIGDRVGEYANPSPMHVIPCLKPLPYRRQCF